MHLLKTVIFVHLPVVMKMMCTAQWNMKMLMWYIYTELLHASLPYCVFCFGRMYPVIITCCDLTFILYNPVIACRPTNPLVL